MVSRGPMHRWAWLVALVADLACNAREAPDSGMRASEPVSSTPAPQSQSAAAVSGTSSPVPIASDAGRAAAMASGASGVAGEMKAAAGVEAPSASAAGATAPSLAGMGAPALDSKVPPEVASATDEWPLPNWNYDNTRHPNTSIDSSNVAKLHEAWRFTFDGSSSFGFVTSNPLVIDGVIYFQDMQSNLYALERETGKVRWKRTYDQPSFGPNGAAIGWGKLFALAGDSTLVALDLADGKDVWKFSPPFTHSEGMDLQPLVYDGQVFAATVPVSTSRGIYAGGSHGVLLSVDAASGMQRWSFDTIDAPDDATDAGAVGGGGAWYPPLIDPVRGLTYWGTGNAVPWPGTPEAPNGGSRPGPNLYASSLVAVGMKDGALAWHYQDRPHDIFDWDFQNTPLIVRSVTSSGTDLIIGAGKTGAVVALDPEAGKVVWRTKVGMHMNDDLTEFPAQSILIYPGVLGGVMSALAYADGVVYVPSVDLPMSYDGSLLIPGVSGGTGVVTAIDVRDGTVRWTARTQAACYGAATIANDLVLTSDENGRVYAFARDTGKEVWHYDAPGGINAPLVVLSDSLLVPVGIGTGMLVAMRLNPSPP